eukprot:gene12790-biopygen589
MESPPRMNYDPSVPLHRPSAAGATLGALLGRNDYLACHYNNGVPVGGQALRTLRHLHLNVVPPPTRSCAVDMRLPLFILAGESRAVRCTVSNVLYPAGRAWGPRARLRESSFPDDRFRDPPRVGPPPTLFPPDTVRLHP